MSGLGSTLNNYKNAIPGCYCDVSGTFVKIHITLNQYDKDDFIHIAYNHTWHINMDACAEISSRDL